jgi:hypothetical protein
MQAPTACIFGFPAATSRSTNALRRGWNRIAVSVGRSSALRSRASPAWDSRVRLRTLVPLRHARGASPHAAAADAALGSRRCMRLIRPPGSPRQRKQNTI